MILLTTLNEVNSPSAVLPHDWLVFTHVQQQTLMDLHIPIPCYWKKQASSFPISPWRGFWLKFYNIGFWENSTVCWGEFPFFLLGDKRTASGLQNSNFHDSSHFILCYSSRIILFWIKMLQMSSRLPLTTNEIAWNTSWWQNHTQPQTWPLLHCIDIPFISNNCSKNCGDIFWLDGIKIFLSFCKYLPRQNFRVINKFEKVETAGTNETNVGLKELITGRKIFHEWTFFKLLITTDIPNSNLNMGYVFF